MITPMNQGAPNFTREPTAAGLSVCRHAGRFAAPGLRRRSVSGGCGSACRSVKATMLTSLAGVCLLLAGCSPYQWTYVRVQDAVSHGPLVSAKITAGLYNPINPDARRARTVQVFTQTNGVARIRIPMCSTRDVRGAYLYSGGVFVGRSDPNDAVGPEVIVEKAGYQPWIDYTPNALRRIDVERSSLESPYVVSLWPTAIEPRGAAPNRRQPIHSETNRMSATAGSER